MSEFKVKIESEWNVSDSLMDSEEDWKKVYEAHPLDKNLLKNYSPHGLSKDSPPPEPDLPDVPDRGPPRFQPDGDYSGWDTTIERLPYDTTGIPPGVMICQMPEKSWFSMEQMLDLKAEGLWDQFLDEFQPEIVVADWYEESQVDHHIFELHVKLLASDQISVIDEMIIKPSEDLETYSHTWKEVSHTFHGYGPGVRFVHFLHRVKNSFLNGFHQTRFTESSVMIRAVKRMR